MIQTRYQLRSANEICRGIRSRQYFGIPQVNLLLREQEVCHITVRVRDA